MIQPNFTTVGKVLEQYRANRGLSLREVAEKLGISHVAYRNYERGTSEMTLQTFQTLCKILKIPVLDAIAGSTDNDTTLPIAKELVEELQSKISLHATE